MVQQLSSQMSPEELYRVQLQQAKEMQLFHQREFEMAECIEHERTNEFIAILKKMSRDQVCKLYLTVDRFGYTLIHQCAFFGNLQILEILIDAFKLNFRQFINYSNQKVKNGQAAGQIFTVKQIENQIKVVIQNWVNQQTLMQDGWTALHLACRKGSSDIFMFLL